MLKKTPPHLLFTFDKKTILDLTAKEITHALSNIKDNLMFKVNNKENITVTRNFLLFSSSMLESLYKVCANLPHSSIATAIQKQSPVGVSIKRCSENMTPVYRAPHMPKRDFDKVTLQLY